MKIAFLGGTGTVTGSKFLVSTDNEDVLVDCGLFQGLKQLRVLNWEVPNLDIPRLKAVLLTHAHLDHCGYLPLLVKHGFRGTIYCTPPTLELVKIILMDSAQIQMEDAEYSNKKGFSKHHPAEPLYNTNDVERTLPLLKAIPFGQVQKINTLSFEYHSAGHILGAASICISDGQKRILFSGDLGRYNDPLMFPPENPVAADYVVMESTYGDHVHDKTPSKDQLRKLILQAWRMKSVLLIPAFAVGRSQNLIYEIIQLKQTNQIPLEIPIYFNSPMGTEVCELYKKHHDFQKLENGEFETYTAQVRFIRSAEESKSLNEQHGPMVIIAASGMLTGGRILHHLKAFAGNPKNTILLAGYQSLGTRGWSLATGQSKVKVHGSFIDVMAQVVTSDSFSAHADQQELLRWLGSIPQKPKKVFLVHGEPAASDELRKQIEEHLKMSVTVPIINATYDLQK